MELKPETFKKEISEALANYEKYIVCIEKTPDQFAASLKSLLSKAIKTYVNRDPELRHGIALDKYVTIIISQTGSERPFCGIYFNLASPYFKKKRTKKSSTKKKS
ncbi:MAG: hypothetical protein K9N52_10265 [Verrucomicrobia bacterium]|nr:hypothetical protein [Verrucomicrobiota bacterium]